MGARLATAAVAIPALLALIFLAPPWALAVTVGAIAVLALIEYTHMVFSAQPRDRAVALGLGVPVIAAAVGSSAPGPLLSAALALLVAGGLTWLVLGRSDFERGLSDLGLILVGVLYVGVLLPHFVWLRHLQHGPAWIAFVLAVVMAGDSMGYFAGRAVGRRPLMPSVSPGKTVEGAVGILLGGVAGGALGRVLFLPDHRWGEVLALAAIMALIGQLGDLSESVFKRAFGAKDAGRILPGHGGFLDRIDSLLFPATLVYYYNLVH